MKCVFTVVAVLLLHASTASGVSPMAPSAIDPSDMERRYQESRSQDRQHSEAMGDIAENGVNQTIEWGNYGIGLVDSARELAKSYDALTDFDATCIDLTTVGAPPVPSSCADDESLCGQCYRDANRELAGMRLNLERLRCVYQAYKRFVDASLSFGDSASGIHAVTGLAWQAERGEIMKAMDRLSNMYDTKYSQMMPNLRTSLEHLGRCESEFFGERDWYARFGFIYYTFLSDRYKR
jgi:hypothetical protein